VWDGFWAVEVSPSPKVHSQLVGVPVEVSVKSTVNGAAPWLGESVNDAVGAGAGGPSTVTTSVLVTVSDPEAFVAVNDTV
jgi:hypothetical protein